MSAIVGFGFQIVDSNQMRKKMRLLHASFNVERERGGRMSQQELEIDGKAGHVNRKWTIVTPYAKPFYDLNSRIRKKYMSIKYGIENVEEDGNEFLLRPRMPLATPILFLCVAS